MIAQVDVLATWVNKFQELNTMPNPPKKSLYENFGDIGIKGDGGVKSK